MEPFQFSEENVRRLKEKYSKEMKDAPDNPIKICMKLIFEGAIEKNPDKRNQLAQDLSVFLTKPDGVINLFLALIDFDTSSQQQTTHNQRFIAVANIITRLPKLCSPYEEFCKNISSQLKPLLISNNGQYFNLASIIFKSMTDSPHAKGFDICKVLLDPIFDGLRAPSSPTRPHEAILAIHNLTLPVDRIPIKSFVPIFPHLFYALIELQDTPSRLKVPLKTSLVQILNGLSSGAACCLLEKTLFYNSDLNSLYDQCEEGSEISIKITNNKKIDYVTYELKLGDVVMKLLETSNNDPLVLEFFFHFKELACSGKDDYQRQMSAALIGPLMDEALEEQEGGKKLDLVRIILCNFDKSLELVYRLLLTYVAVLRSHQEKLDHSQKQSISSCLNILDVVCQAMRRDRDLYILKKKCLPTLKELEKLLENREQCSDLYEEVYSTASWIELHQQDEKKLENELRVECDTSMEELDVILRDLNDKLVPVRVHALVRLKQMIMANEQLAVSRLPQLSAKVEAFLSDEEPYVFLACINLMAEMALRKTSEILPKMLDLYSKQEMPTQARLNAGEVLIKLIKQLNETTPIYAQQVIHTLLSCCRDPDELVRMSSLTNVGEIGRNLGDSLGKYILDILAAVEFVLQNDSVDVQCAAIDLLRTTLMGVDKFTMESIQADLAAMYLLLKQVKGGRTLDERLFLQADLALDEMDRIARELLGVEGADGRLVKNIRVLTR